MKTLKQLLASVSALAIVLTSVTPAFAAFSDVPSDHWVSPYLTSLVEEGVIDGTKDTFRPNAEITRAELVKMVVNYDNMGENPTADDYSAPATPSFSDVASDAWYYNHVEYAVDAGFVDGSKAMFNPNSSITRAETLKVVLNGLGVETNSTRAIPFSDVASDAWYAPYVATAYNNCIVKDATSFRPNDSITRAEAVKIFAVSMDPTTECFGDEPTTTVDPTTTTEPTTTTTPKPTNVAAGTVEVTVSSESPDARAIPKNANNVPFLALDITASDDEDVKLTGVKVYHTGLGDEDEIDTVKVLEDGVQKGSDRSFTGDEDVASLNLSADSVVIKKGTTKTVVIAADIETTTGFGNHAVMIQSASDLTFVGVDSDSAVTLAGSFPIVGKTMDIQDVAVGDVTVSFQSISDSTVEAGESDVEFAKIKMIAGSAEDVYIKKMTMEFSGALDDGDVSNLYIEVDGERVSDIIDTAVNDKVTFDLTAVNDMGVLIEDGSTEYFYVRGDLTGAIDSFGSVTIDFDEATSDIVVSGGTYGFGVDVNSTANTYSVAVQGGDITFSFKSSSKDVAADTTEVEFGTLTIQNMGEAIEIQKGWKIEIVASDEQDDLQNIKFVDANGSTVIGTYDGTDADNTSHLITIGDDVIVEAGETLVLTLYADILSSATDGDEFNFSIDMSNIKVEGVSSDGITTNYDIKPSGDIETKIYTVAKAGLTVTAKSLNNDTYVEKVEDAVVWHGTVRANDVEDVKVTRIAFVNTGTATTSDVDNYALYKKVGSEMVALETGLASKAPNSTFTFTDLDEEDSKSGFVVKAGEEFELILKADIGSTVTAAHTLILSLDASEMVAQDSDGDDLTDPAGTTDVASGATFSLAETGSITIALDSSLTPDSGIVVAGTTNLPVAVYKFTASDEDVKVTDLSVRIVEDVTTAYTDVTNDSDAIDAVALYYEADGTAVLKMNSSAVAKVSSIESNYKGTGFKRAFFQDLGLVASDGDDVLVEVRVDINDMDDNNSSATAKSGHAFSTVLDLAYSEAQGFDSGADLTLAGVTSASDVFYVTNNKVTIALSSAQDTVLADGEVDLIKFTATSAGDNSDAPDLKTVSISVTAPANVTIDNFVLYNDNNTAIASDATTVLGGTAVITLTPAAADEIEGGSEVYRVTADVAIGGTAADNLTARASIAVNSSAIGNDGVTWVDGGTNGTDGVAIKWIDFGSADTETTKIENILKN